MGIEAIDHNDAGALVVPESRSDWDGWVSASRTRNWCKHDPLLDWLHLHGDANGFERDPAPDPRADYQAFIFRQGHAFEAAVLAHLEGMERVVPFEGGIAQLTSLDAARATFEAMARGEPIIYQGVLRNPESRTFGAPDLLMRSDVLQRLFPDSISEAEAAVGASGISATGWHYRVVDIKFTGLKLDRHWHAASKHLAYMAQTFVYNEALGRVQDYVPAHSYLLGRGWEKGTNDTGSTSCMGRLAPVAHDHVADVKPLRTVTGEAADWVRRVRQEGRAWDPRAEPRMPELRPNPGNQQNQPWHRAVQQLARETEDVTLAWRVGLQGRELALAADVTRWTDPRFTAELAGVGRSYRPALDQILATNRAPDGPAVSPGHVAARRDEWGTPQAVEFYVDFETVNSLNDDFARIPQQNGQPLIFMIGCGHVEGDDWRFECFIANHLTVASEAEIVEQWLSHMEAVRKRLAPDVERPLVFHWSAAETITMSGLKSARARSPERSLGWLEPNWFDFLNDVVRKEPVVVRGPMGFGLKTVAKSMKGHGLIDTEWKDGVTDGLGAMVAAWWCAEEANRRGCTLREIELMQDSRLDVEDKQDVRTYNEIDCKVMMEIVAYLRANH